MSDSFILSGGGGVISRGVGVAIQAGRASSEARGWFLLRRFGTLLAIGLVHMLFIWNGDILALYGVCGLLLIPLLGLPEYALVVLWLGPILWPNVASYPVAFPVTATLKSLAAGAFQVNFRVPSGVASGTAWVQLSAAWVRGPSVNIAVR
jgi:uncharacterized membrane protein YeiB